MNGRPNDNGEKAGADAASSVSEGAHAYAPKAIETARQAAWQARDAFLTPAISDPRPRRYVKPSAPFTSGNIHIGHVRSYSIGDAYARFHRARGEAVLFAFGFDAFGLPAELGAIAQGVPPGEWVQRCAEHMRSQLLRLGFSFDWERAFMSSDVQMYRWSQWLFLTLLSAGLIYRGTGTVDWCDHCQTTLASIQVDDGLCWRCHNPVRLIQRPQWLLRVSAYLEENDRRIAELSPWDETSIASQRYVLGRVDGVEASLRTLDGRTLTAFTPHAKEVEQARFVILSPRHPEAEAWAQDPQVQAELEDMRSGGWERSSRDAEAIPVLDTGGSVVSPDGQSLLPVLISPVVDSRFGPTVVLGVPAADRTDEVIAARLGLDSPPDPPPSPAAGQAPHGSDAGQAPHGSDAGQAPHGSDAGHAPHDHSAREAPPGPAAVREAVRYRAFDFSISRQRSWGTPIPIVYCEDCGAVPVPMERLPVELPRDVIPTGEGNPLAARADFVETSCPRCGGPGRRETDTLDCHFDALWLWVPVCVPPERRDDTLEEIFALPDLRAWLPCERVVAGSDSGNFVFDQRLVTKALRDLGPLDFLADGEPFAGCLFHEMVIADGRKMSKHLGNVVDPDELVAQHGADTVRLAVLYAARPQRSLNWTDSAVQHCHRFLTQLWEYSQAQFAANRTREQLPPAAQDVGKQRTEHLRARLAKWCDVALERITRSLADLEMHSAVRDAMRLFERVQDFEARVLERRQSLSREDSDVLVAALATLAAILTPFTPHLAEQLWLDSGHGQDGADPPWPQAGAIERLAGGSLAQRETPPRPQAAVGQATPSQAGS
jgi:leucyl-tRNA synthetase